MSYSHWLYAAEHFLRIHIKKIYSTFLKGQTTHYTKPPTTSGDVFCLFMLYIIFRYQNNSIFYSRLGCLSLIRGSRKRQPGKHSSTVTAVKTHPLPTLSRFETWIQNNNIIMKEIIIIIIIFVENITMVFAMPFSLVRFPCRDRIIFNFLLNFTLWYKS